MFILPPPPRYPTQAAFNAAVAAGHTVPIVETNNVLSNPEDQFLAGEGTYVLKEDLHLATPPPHPSEAPIVNPNPLTTTPQPETAGTKFTLTSLDSRPAPPAFGSLLSTTTMSPSTAEHANEDQSSHEAKRSSDAEGKGPAPSPADGGHRTSVSALSAPAFGEGNVLLAPEKTKDANKRRKPKNNMTKSNSSFISRVIINDSLSKKLSDRPSGALFIFANINRAFQWLDFSSANKADYLTKILFTKAHCLTHDVNMVTKGTGHIDVIMGFSTGEIIWWEPISQRYTRLNKKGVINSTPVSHIRWVPGSENLFMAAHMDGTLVVYDKEKEDAIFNPEEEEPRPSHEGECAKRTSFRREIQVTKSVHSKNQKTNPVAIWKLSNQRINCFAFSPDNRHLAVASEDGTLRISDYLEEELLHVFNAYYGGLTCLCWSPDGKYVLTGGQDDLISIWCPSQPDSALIARCQGHHSWVTSVEFDPWRCDERNYRFGSVGEDCRLCLWDFNVGMLHRPKATHRVTSTPSRPTTVQRAGTQDTWSSSRLQSDSNLTGTGAEPVEPRSRTAILPPVLTKQADKDPLCWLQFTKDAIVTSSKSGHIRTWLRPSDSVSKTNGQSEP